MVFNWFRRQHNESSETPQEQPDPPKSESPPESTETPTPTASPPAAADMLAFAKAAYKNIQQKQQVEESSEVVNNTSGIEVTATETTPLEENVVIADTAEVKPVEASDVEIIAPITSDIPTTTKSEITEELGLKVKNFTLKDSTEPTIEAVTNVTEEGTPAPLSFLERAAAERQARQERLIASAMVEEVEPVAETTTAAPEVVTEIPDLAFDEGFVWSVEVLAAQGRRAEDVSIEEINWLKKLRQGLDKTRRNIVNQLKAIVGQGPLNQAAVMEIESLLLQADVGVEATDYIIEALQKRLREEILPPDAAIAYLKTILKDMLDAPIAKSQRANFFPEKDTLNIWLMTGVNGAGKTTTIGKLAHLSQKSGYKTLIGAADTFRAAAVEQVRVWGQRSNVEVISNPGKNTDPAAVVFDAIAAATARDTELLLVDTAGRLQNKKNLMDELSKIRRIIDKKAPNAKVESLLVLDATLGQNGLRQAEVFSKAAQLSGVVLTKLDGTAKGGVAIAVVKELGLPIRFVGAGEGIEDLRPFSSYEFVEALLSG
jgi:fused signal recognition particle receptor